MLQFAADSAMKFGPIRGSRPAPALTNNRNGDATMATAKICSIDGCGKPVRARGWCANHYALWQRNGAPAKRAKSDRPTECAIDGCSKPMKGRGYCSAHYWRLLNYGDPLALKPKPQKPIYCAVAGCDNPPNGKRGMCNAHYLRWYRFGDPNTPKVRADNGAPSKWLRDHIEHAGDECLTWPFAKGGDGRGRIQNDVSPQAHRAMCILAHGEPPSDIHEAAHRCGKGHEACVNPRHLYWATPVENAADRWEHGTQTHGECHAFAKLTVAQVMEIRRMEGAASQAEIGAMFGVDGETIGNIHRRETWAWL